MNVKINHLTLQAVELSNDHALNRHDLLFIEHLEEAYESARHLNSGETMSSFTFFMTAADRLIAHGWQPENMSISYKAQKELQDMILQKLLTRQ